jgi:hypothetical protein
MKICESIVLMYFQKGGVHATSVMQATTLSSWAFLPDQAADLDKGELLMSKICACSASHPSTSLRYAQGERGRVCLRTDSVHEPGEFLIAGSCFPEY